MAKKIQPKAPETYHATHKVLSKGAIALLNKRIADRTWREITRSVHVSQSTLLRAAAGQAIRENSHELIELWAEQGGGVK